MFKTKVRDGYLEFYTNLNISKFVFYHNLWHVRNYPIPISSWYESEIIVEKKKTLFALQILGNQSNKYYFK